MFLGQHLNSMEIFCQPRASQLVGLLQRIALGDQYELVPSEKVGDGVRDYGSGGTQSCAETAKDVVEALLSAPAPT